LRHPVDMINIDGTEIENHAGYMGRRSLAGQPGLPDRAGSTQKNGHSHVYEILEHLCIPASMNASPRLLPGTVICATRSK